LGIGTQNTLVQPFVIVVTQMVKESFEFSEVKSNFINFCKFFSTCFYNLPYSINIVLVYWRVMMSRMREALSLLK